MEILHGIIYVIIVAAIVYWLLVKYQGDAELEIKTAEKSSVTVKSADEKSVVLICQMPMVNKGKQIATIIDCFTRHLLPYEQFDGIKASSRVMRIDAIREDDYFESYLLKQNKRIDLIVEVTLETRRDEDIRKTLENMVDLPVDILVQLVTRANLRIEKTRVVFDAKEIADAVGVKLAD